MALKRLTSVIALSLGSLTGVAHAEAVSQDYLPLTVKNTSAQHQATGFIEGQSLSGSTRNWYARERATKAPLYRYYKSDGTRRDSHSRDNWVQGTILDYSSGFTQGTVGFATQVAAYNAIALERGRAAVAGPNNRTLTHSDGDVIGQWSKLGLANLQARVSNTTLTAGRQSINTPVFAYIGNRALPSSFDGVAVHSAEFDNLSVDLSSFSRVSTRTEQGRSRFTTEYSAIAANSDRVSLAGLNYQPLRSLTTSLYVGHVEDIWNQYYLGASHELGDRGVLGLTTGFNWYGTRDTGSARLGPIDNDTFSLSFTLAHQAHSLTLAYQEVSGDEYFDYVHDTNAIFLANSLFSDYNGPNEKSLQFGYVLDLAGYGVPGLRLNAYTARGWGIDGTHYKGNGYNVRNLDGEHHREWSLGASYVVQSGPLQATSIRATYTAHRATRAQIDGNVDELRVVTTIPFNIL
ncbi:OprD family outer membrane porin [Pseudomonas sp. zfem002]|uniref:OprD family outer membrane porin n=1 Tax=Pseudomonas sp. zfem002 TaxID=3078197 RepID=UPI003977BAEA